MSAINNIGEQTLSLAPILNNRSQQMQIAERKIEHIDKQIEAKTNYKNALIESRDLHIEVRDLHIEVRDLLIESRDLDRKRIANNKKMIDVLDDTNVKLRSLIDGKQPNRSRSVESRADNQLNGINKLDKKLTTLAKQDTVLKEQTKVVDTKADKLALKLDHTEKQMVKLEAKTVKDISAPIPTTTPNKRTGLATNYYPRVVKTKEEDLLNVERNVRELKITTTIREQISIQSQQNLYDSIKARLMSKLV